MSRILDTILPESIYVEGKLFVPQICARTGMAHRTVGNALTTLRRAGIPRPSNRGAIRGPNVFMV